MGIFLAFMSLLIFLGVRSVIISDRKAEEALKNEQQSGNLAGNTGDASASEGRKNESLGNQRIEVAKNEDLTLYFIEDTGEIEVYSQKGNISFLSNPKGIDEDTIAAGMTKMNMHSQLLVEYIDEQSNLYVVNNFTGSIKEKTYEYSLQENGILVTYFFEKVGFDIPVFYGLEKDYVKAQILSSEIKQTGKYKISAITLLPYMGSAGSEEDGYLFIPDGSGAIINFNNNKSGYQNYSGIVYGRDKALNSVQLAEIKEDITMPVFGIKRENSAVLGIIHSGEYQSEIRAEVGGKSSSYNAVYPIVRFIQNERSTLLENTANEKDSVMQSEQFIHFPAFEVRYYFLIGEDTDYSHMALRYQQYLVEEKGMVSRLSSDERQGVINLDLIGAVKKQDNILGIPYHTVEVLTSYEDVLKIENELKDKEIGLNLRYLGFMKDGLRDKIPTKVTYESKLGSKAKFKKILEFAKENRIGFYPNFDLVNMYKTGNGLNSIFHTTRNVSRAASLQYDYLSSTGYRDKSISPWYLLKPEKLQEVSKKLLKSLKSSNINSFALEGIGNMVYSDFKKNSFSRRETGEEIISTLENIMGEVSSISIDKAYAYAFPYADAITNVPVTSSDYDVTDRDIPFYQIVMSGFAHMTSAPINMQSNIRDYKLKLVEYGVWPSYQLVSRDPSVLVNTDYAGFYGVGYDDWKEDVISTIEFFAPLKETYGVRISEHKELAEGVYRITYENGIKVYINYNSTNVTVEQVTINPFHYTVVGGN